MNVSSIPLGHAARSARGRDFGPLSVLDPLRAASTCAAGPSWFGGLAFGFGAAAIMASPVSQGPAEGRDPVAESARGSGRSGCGRGAGVARDATSDWPVLFSTGNRAGARVLDADATCGGAVSARPGGLSSRDAPGVDRTELLAPAPGKGCRTVRGAASTLD